MPKKRKKSVPLSANKNKYYPVFLDLSDKKCIIIGGGKVAERKCLALLKSKARVAIISPGITRRLAAYREKGLITHIKRGYRHGDIKSAHLVIAATDSEETNRKVAKEASGRGTLLNIADAPSLCNFIVPSVVRKGHLVISVSTGGASPAAAKAIKTELKRLYGHDFSQYLMFLKNIRPLIMKKEQNKKKRTILLEKLGSAKMLNMLRKKGFKGAKKAAVNYIDNAGS